MEHQVLKQWIFRIFSPKFETIPEALYYWWYSHDIGVHPH
jgi:hypothetical protein